jgi:hypothetical protein
MTQTEVLRLALEALYGFIPYLPLEHDKPQCDRYDQAITAIKAALETKEEPWEKFCDSHCVWTDHHPDCKLAQIEQPKVRTGNCLRVGVCASEGHKIQPQRIWVGLNDEEIAEVEDEYIVEYRIPAGSAWNFAKDIEAKLKEKNT